MTATAPPDHEVGTLTPEAHPDVAPALEVSKRPNPLQRLANVWRYRELLGNLTRKELKVKYKNSVLGFVWTLLNPALYLVVFSVVFAEVLRVQVPYYAIFFLSGLLVWNFFSTSLGAGTGSITMNAQLVQKVWFPREILPLASIGAAIVHFFLQATVLIAALALFRRAPSLDYLPALPLAVVVLLLLASALAIALSAINVYLRDTEHLLELALLAWFWLSCIVYPYRLVVERLGPGREWMASLNPVIPIVTTFQRVLYNPEPVNFGWYINQPSDGSMSGTDPANVVPDITAPALITHPLSWYITRLSVVGVVAIALLLGALWLFGRLEDDMAEEI
ncbi:ABC transporter permease [Iamia majanohamensis]|uniref:Transport permease protein n=1 Tax=Iamia majanohamensis TaxID=467976 RepID=A0AAE9Y7N2_9ACTN|nr:ABC transporter permease [Iamia majanohamensis]WCO65819.1 ABC transporter permease [Iamia majanohamensis]